MTLAGLNVTLCRWKCAAKLVGRVNKIQNGRPVNKEIRLVGARVGVQAVCILPSVCILSPVCSLQSAVCSLQSAFYTDRNQMQKVSWEHWAVIGCNLFAYFWANTEQYEHFYRVTFDRLVSKCYMQDICEKRLQIQLLSYLCSVKAEFGKICTVSFSIVFVTVFRIPLYEEWNFMPAYQFQSYWYYVQVLKIWPPVGHRVGHRVGHGLPHVLSTPLITAS